MNKKQWMMLGGVFAVLLVAAAVGAQAASADTATPPAPPDERGASQAGQPGQPPNGRAGDRLAGQHGLRGRGPAEMEAAAGILGMSIDDLTTELKSGKTLENLAEEKGIGFEDLKAAMQAARKQEMLDWINQAVTDGKMTQDKADWLTVGLEKGYLDGPGFELGPGMGFGGPRGGPGPMPQATQQPGN
jgi:hypothetical protein